MTALTFYGGVDEVGGTKIVLEDKGTTVLDEWGKSYDRYKRYYNGFLTPRTFGEYLRLGFIPWLPGIYRSKFEEEAGEKQHSNPSVQAVLVSHSHTDHCGYISFLDPIIPVFCSSQTHDSIRAYEDVSGLTLDTEITSYREYMDGDGLPRQHRVILGNHQLVKTGDLKKPYEIRRASKKDMEKHPERVPTHEATLIYNKIKSDIERTFITRNKFSVGSIEFELFPVDHSAFDACGQIIHTSDATIAYTGDIRFHGLYGERSLRFVERLKEEDAIDILITDGTRINEEITFPEAEIKTQLEKAIKGTNGLVSVIFSPRDLCRLHSIREAVEETGREFVTSPKSALLWMYQPIRNTLKYSFGYDISPGNRICVYERRSESSTRSNRSIASYKAIEEIGNEEIKMHPEKYVVHLSFYDFPELLDFSPPPGSRLVISSSEPFDEESELEESKITNWCTMFGMPYCHIHSSGHMSGPDFRWMVKEVKPKTILPIHASRQNRLLMREMFPDRTKLLDVGEKFEIKNGLLNYM